MEITYNLNTSPNQKIINSNQTPSTTITSGGGNGQIFVTPDVGKIGHINSLYINIPAVGSSGTHTIQIKSQNAGIILNVTSNAGTAITIEGLSVSTGTPTPSTDIVNLLRGLRFDHDNPLYIKYINNTNANHSAARTYTVQYIAEAETDF